MKAKHQKAYIAILLAAGGLCLLAVLMATGLLSGEQNGAGKNALGGTGGLHAVTQNYTVILPPFCDGDTIYHMKYIEGKGNELYAYRTKTGKDLPVCTRVSCGHDTPECCLYPLYRNGEKPFLDYFPVDGFLYYFYLEGMEERDITKGQIVLCRWEVETGKKEEVARFPAGEVLEDEDGMEYSVQYGVSYVERINADTLFVQTGVTLYLFDNRFELKESFPGELGTAYAWSEDFLLWMVGGEHDLCAYQISTGKLWQRLVQTAYGEKRDCSSQYFYCRGSKVYCTVGERLVEFEIGKEGVEELADITLPAQLAMFGDVIYYQNGEKICSLNPETGEKKELPDMSYVPKGEFSGKLFDFEMKLYTKDGRKVAR